TPYDEVYTDVIARVCKEFNLDVDRADETYGPGLIIAEAVLNFAEHVAMNAARLWIAGDPEHKQRLQVSLFPKGVSFSAEGFGTPVTCLMFSQLPANESE